MLLVTIGKTCRTANGYDINGFGQMKDGRGNICPVTIIMPTLAMQAKEEFVLNLKETNTNSEHNESINKSMIIDAFIKS